MDRGKSHIRNINRKTKVYGIYYIIRNFTLSFNKMGKNEKKILCNALSTIPGEKKEIDR